MSPPLRNTGRPCRSWREPLRRVVDGHVTYAGVAEAFDMAHREVDGFLLEPQQA